MDNRDLHFNLDGTKSVYSNLELSQTLEFHRGCINSLSWSADGANLLSASDDTHLAVWSYSSLKLESSTNTGHTGNVFSARWLQSGNYPPERIVTGASDGQVRLFSIRPDGSIDLEKIFPCHTDRIKKIEPDPTLSASVFRTASEDGTVREFDLRQHQVKASSTASQSHQHTSNADQDFCKETLLLDANTLQIGFHSISSSPLRPEYFVVGGVEPVARIYDRRYMSRSSATHAGPYTNQPITPAAYAFDNPAWFWTPASEHADLLTGVRFAKNSMELLGSFSNDFVYSIDPTTCQQSTDSNDSRIQSGEEQCYFGIQAAWSLGEWQTVIDLLSNLIKKHGRYRRVPLWSVILGMEYVNRAVAFILRGSISDLNHAFEDNRKAGILLKECPEICIKIQVLVQLFLDDSSSLWSNICNLIEQELDETDPFRILLLANDAIFRTTQADSIASINSHSNTLAERNNVLKQLVKLLDPFDIVDSLEFKSVVRNNIVINGYRQKYSGHVNSMTTKDVSYVDNDCRFVASGSDGGYFMIWDQEPPFSCSFIPTFTSSSIAAGASAKLIFIGRSDSRVVNCIESHPKFPVLAVGGIDSEIKIWEPNFDQATGSESDVLTPASNDDSRRWRRIAPTEYESVFAEIQTRQATEIFRIGSLPIQCEMQ